MQTVSTSRSLFFTFTVQMPDSAMASTNLINVAFRAPCDWIGNPAVDVGFMPAGAVGADFELSREGALGDLAVDGGPGQMG